VESTILSFSEEVPRLLRPGGVSLEEIETVIGRVEARLGREGPPPAPGMLPRHYAPRTPIVVDRGAFVPDSYRGRKIGLLAFKRPRDFAPFFHVELLSQEGDLREAAANLFAALRRLDEMNLDLIVAEAIPEVGLGRAIMDRLRRASRGENEADLFGAPLYSERRGEGRGR
jgi:L-threonylcarbamoyladenylate synthase